MKIFLKRAVFPTALLIFSLGCNQLKTSQPTQQKPQEAQKAIPKLFKLNCRAMMNPDSNSNLPPITLKAETQIFSVNDFSTNASRIKMTTGPFSLISKVIAEARDHEFVLDPTFCFEIFTGDFTETPRCTNGMSLQDLFNGHMSLPLTSDYGQIVNFTYLNQKISFLSYSCDLVDAEEN